ncbi:MAG: nucleotidyltransferase domain-containing protein [Bacteroidales bacterium]|nr:nucleotidyltransferase domain-containing protein [Bacteroidales bacterium]MBN2819496.1 nucleotidyltransferase domain-containing protein [Bacteroidales bacterium]
MPYGLKEQTIIKLKELFSAVNELDEVILYGSRAKGNYKNSSDVDITLKGEHLLSASRKYL